MSEEIIDVVRRLRLSADLILQPTAVADNCRVAVDLIERLTREGKEYQAHMEGIVADLRAERDRLKRERDEARADNARLREALNKISVSVDLEKACEIAFVTLLPKEPK